MKTPSLLLLPLLAATPFSAAPALAASLTCHAPVEALEDSPFPTQGMPDTQAAPNTTQTLTICVSNLDQPHSWLQATLTTFTHDAQGNAAVTGSKELATVVSGDGGHVAKAYGKTTFHSVLSWILRVNDSMMSDSTISGDAFTASFNGKGFLQKMPASVQAIDTLKCVAWE